MMAATLLLGFGHGFGATLAAGVELQSGFVPAPPPAPPAGGFYTQKGEVSYKYTPGPDVFPSDAKHPHGLRLVDNMAQCCAICKGAPTCAFFSYSAGAKCYNMQGHCCFLKTIASKVATAGTVVLPPPPSRVSRRFNRDAEGVSAF